MLQFPPGTDVALLNAMINVIITEKLYDQHTSQTYTEGFDELAEHVGLHARGRWRRSAASTPTRCARWRGPTPAPSGDHLLGHGDLPARPRHRQRALPDRAGADLRARSAGPGTGLHPLRGQNNVQGASDAGLIPMFFPDYASVENAESAPALRDRLGHARSTPSRA